MGQKVNAHGFRVGVSKPWDAKWYAEKDYAALLNEDVKIREFLKKQLYIAGVSRIEIERSAKRIKLIIHTAKPGMVIGRGGAGIEDIKKALKAFTTKTVDVNIAEIKQAEMDATLLVTAPPALQRARVLARPGMTEDQFALILSRQMPDAEKRARATHIIETLSLASVQACVLALIDHIRKARHA